MFINNIINSLILNIKFYFNIKSKLIYNFRIFIYKYNYINKIILNYIKKFKYNIFNIRNKLNFNKSKHTLLKNKKKTGKSRLGSSSSSILIKGLLWFGFRNIKIKKYKFNKNLLNFILINKKNIISIYNIEIIKFIYNITNNNLNFYYKTINKNFYKNYYINNINNYTEMLNSINNINFLH